MRSSLRILWGASGVVVLASAWVWSSRERPAQAPPAERPPVIAATGRVEARREAAVSAKAGGRVERHVGREGDWVEPGQAVVLLDQASEKAALAEAEAERFRACSTFERVERLHAGKVVSDQERDEADAACRLAAAKAARAQAALDERTVRAPFAGRLLKTFLEDGETLPPGDAPLFVLGDVRRLKVRAEVDELDLGRLRVGQRAFVYPDSLPGERFEGRVARASGILGRKRLRSEDPRERMDAKVLEVEIELPASERLKPGSSVEVKIQAGS